MGGDCKRFASATDRCWLFVERAMTWGAAQQECIRLRGFLAVESSAQLTTAIEGELTSTRLKSKWWIGLRKEEDADAWTWVDGTCALVDLSAAV